MQPETVQMTRDGLRLIPVAYDPFSPGALTAVYQPIPPQQEIWLSCAVGGDDANKAYNESFSLRISGPLVVQAFEHAFNMVLCEHEALRSSFSRDGRYMMVYEQANTTLDILDISGEHSDKQQSVIADYYNRHVDTAFDLENGPLVRAALFRLSPTNHFFTFIAHHIVCDGWSLGTVLYFLSKRYNALVGAESEKLPIPDSMEAYIREVGEFRNSEDSKKIEQYWISKFAGNVPPPLDLPTDYQRPSRRTYRSRRADFPLDVSLVNAVKNLGKTHNCSFVTTLLVAYQAFVHRLSGQDDIVIGLPAADQAASGYLHLVGHCVNLVPIRSRLKAGETFIAYLKRRRTDILDDLEHQRMTFGELIKKLNIKRDPARVPLVSLVFNVDLEMNKGVTFHGLEYQLLSNPRVCETFDLFLNVSGSEEQLILEWSYNTQLFKQETIARFMEQFETMLRQIVADPTTRVDALLRANEFADGTTTDRTIQHVSGPQRAYALNRPFTSYLTDVATKTPRRTAIVTSDIVVDYGTLETRANQLAHYLLAQGIRSGDVIAVAMNRSTDLVVALLGCVKSGATYVPVDPNYPKQRVEYMLQDSGARVLLTESEHRSKFSTSADVLCYDHLKDCIAQFSVQPPAVTIDGNQLVYILYTSGSTGLPKGVQIRHASLTNTLLSLQESPGITPDDTMLAITTISFDISAVELYLPLITGAKLLLADADTARDAHRLVELAQKHKATIVQATPATWRMVMDCTPDYFPVKVFCGGEAMKKDLARKLVNKCREVWNMYGPTETTIYSTIKQIDSNSIDLITIGKPIANTRVYVLDENRSPVAIGQEGQLYIAGIGVAAGYRNRSDLTEEKFSADLIDPETTMYATGDIAKFTENGDLVCLGRIDHQVKIRGFRIELGEIESQLSDLDGIREAAVITREDVPGDQRLVAYVVTDTGYVDRDDISRWRKILANHLPHYMMPNDWVCMDHLPMTANNKVDRKALPVPETIRRPETERTQTTEALTPNEQLVFRIWKSIFNTDKLEKNDDFFELGGHSMLAVDVMTRIEEETGIKLPLSALFEHSTVSGLAKLLDDQQKVRWNCLVPIKPEGSKTPLYIVHGAGLNVLLFSSLVNNLDKEQPIYGLQARGLNGEDEPFTSIPEMAAHYISEIIEQNPEGPYCLSGFSLGGLIAYEMAQQLLAMGKKVKLLAMFDTFSHETDKYDPWYKKYPNRALLFFLKAVHSVYLLIEDPKGTFHYKYTSVKRKLIQLYWKLSGKQDKVVGFFGYLNKIDRINQKAVYDYVMKPIDMEIHVFRATIHRFYAKDFKYLGWKKFAKKGVRIFDIPGEHNLIFAPPNDKEFGRKLQQALDEA